MIRAKQSTAGVEGRDFCRKTVVDEMLREQTLKICHPVRTQHVGTNVSWHQVQ